MGEPGARDEDWFTGLYAAHYPEIVRYAVRRLGELETSVELAQEVFVVAWRRRREVPDHGLPWLYGVARRLLANEWRSRRARPAPVPLAEPEPLGTGSEPDTVAAVADLHAALAALSEADREILRLVGWEPPPRRRAGTGWWAVEPFAVDRREGTRVMWAERRVLSELEPADPARGVEVPPATVTAAQLIARAEATEAFGSRGRPSPVRRPLLAGAAAASVVAAVAAYALVQSEPDPTSDPPGPGVVVPIAYEINESPPPAAAYLRYLAAQLTDAPYDAQTGAYAYLRHQLWGDAPVISGDYAASQVVEWEYWIGADGTGTQRQTRVGVEFPDEASRQYYEANPEPDWSNLPETSVYPYSLADPPRGGYVTPGDPIPTDRRERLERMIGTDDGEVFFHWIDILYARHLVPREHRAALLTALGEVPGLVWRGQVTDRAGRGGVAVSYDGMLDGGVPGQHVLVFEPRTGELLSHEYIRLRTTAVDHYRLYLDSGWTDDPGPALTER